MQQQQRAVNPCFLFNMQCSMHALTQLTGALWMTLGIGGSSRAGELYVQVDGGFYSCLGVALLSVSALSVCPSDTEQQCAALEWATQQRRDGPSEA